MRKTEALQTAALAVAAAVLVAVLVFLYDKTQAIDLRAQNEILEMLRELKEIDSRWDLDLMRARTEAAGGRPPANRAATAGKTLENLNSAARQTSSAALAGGLPDLSAAIAQKAKLVEGFMTASGSARAAMQDVVRGAAELGAQTGAARPRAAALEQALNALAAAAPQYYFLAGDAHRVALEAASAELRAAPDALREQAAKLEFAVQTLLRLKPAEEALFAKVAFVTAGPRLDNITYSFNREVEAALADKERYRVYLIAYAGALLVLIAWLGGKLKAANVSLEERVAQRTRELSDALAHLKESEAQLIQSEKMSSLGQMVAGVAHELNTPLAYVKNSLGAVAARLLALGDAIDNTDKLLVLLRAGNDAEGLSRQFAAVAAQVAQLKREGVVAELGGLVRDGLHGTGQMAEIVGNLKDFSRLDRSRLSSFNVNDGLTSTLVLARHLLKSITVDRHFAEVPEIVCAPSQINQVFLNLLTNAAQAIGPGQGVITLTTRRDGDGVAVDVADNGTGIAPEVLPRIFDPFFTTKEVGKGTGLGLSISYKIVQQHGGRIDVESKPGAGTRFTVWLPLAPPAQPPSPA